MQFQSRAPERSHSEWRENFLQLLIFYDKNKSWTLERKFILWAGIVLLPRPWARDWSAGSQL
jgi:hypothetical protein